MEQLTGYRDTWLYDPSLRPRLSRQPDNLSALLAKTAPIRKRRPSLSIMQTHSSTTKLYEVDTPAIDPGEFDVQNLANLMCKATRQNAISAMPRAFDSPGAGTLLRYAYIPFGCITFHLQFC